MNQRVIMKWLPEISDIKHILQKLIDDGYIIDKVFVVQDLSLEQYLVVITRIPDTFEDDKPEEELTHEQN